jgi:hypothetical protein
MANNKIREVTMEIKKQMVASLPIEISVGSEKIKIPAEIAMQ